MSFRKWPMLVANIMVRTVLSAPLLDGCCAALMLIMLLLEHIPKSETVFG
jgi:hypothetical protein